MVTGIEKFREHFAQHEDHYAIIGGAACDLLFDAAGLPFRATKDIDGALCRGGRSRIRRGYQGVS